MGGYFSCASQNSKTDGPCKERFLSQEVSVSGHSLPTLPTVLSTGTATYAEDCQKAVQLTEAEFTWFTKEHLDGQNSAGPEFVLGPLSVTFPPGLNLVCGPIASGKTMLLLGKQSF